jgi:TRAP-type C4-dicarboxylate transport system permease small subunit
MSVLRRLGVLHDALTQASFSIAALCTAAIAVAFCYEVVARYFFNAPTEWATPFVTYGLCAMIFLAMPQLTRGAEHVTITLILDRTRGSAHRRLRAACGVVAAVACLFAAWFSADATLAQYRMGILTHPPYAIDKWMLSVLIPYGMLSSAVYFLRQVPGAKS